MKFRDTRCKAETKTLTAAKTKLADELKLVKATQAKDELLFKEQKKKLQKELREKSAALTAVSEQLEQKSAELKRLEQQPSRKSAESPGNKAGAGSCERVRALERQLLEANFRNEVLQLESIKTEAYISLRLLKKRAEQE